jgi:peptidoglycan LD-endopeptidase LytH
MRKIVLFVGLLLGCCCGFAQTHDTTALRYKPFNCYTHEIDTMTYPSLVFAPARKRKSVIRNPWNIQKLPFHILEAKSYDPYPVIPVQEEKYGQRMDTIPVYQNFDKLNTKVLQGGVKKEEVQKAIKQLRHHINQWLLLRSQIDELNDTWIFPLRGYNYHAIGGNGDGYSDKGYHYLDGNKHGAHPAHDIFINDKNQDCIDDHSHKPVDVLAVDHGIVIACSDTWETNSDLRGGKYIWIYHFVYGSRKNGNSSMEDFFARSGVITYYAHNSKIFVSPGQEVKPGQKIAEVGRTGYNAYKKRSPTHLHFSAFRLVDDIPVPFNPYQQLKKAKTL